MKNEIANFIFGVSFVFFSVGMVGFVFLWMWGDPKRNRTFTELFQKIFHIAVK